MYNEPNVELVTEKPVRIGSNSIISKTPRALTDAEISSQPAGSYRSKTAWDAVAEEVEREIDVLIWGTGFDMDDSGGHFQVYGVGGKNLSQTWKDYPQTYWSK
jgi:hypothetical protein